jgi:predicted transcriptional regulator YdeE
MSLEYEIIEKSDFTVLGMALSDIPFNEGPKHIPQLWPKFVSRIEEIAKYSVEPYGEFGAMKDFDPTVKTFKYLAGLSVASDAKVPSGMEKWSIPTQTYMAVRCRLNTLMEAVKMLNSSVKYTHNGGVEFEWYPPRYHEAPEENWMYYYFPIRKRN